MHTTDICSAVLQLFNVRWVPVLVLGFGTLLGLLVGGAIVGANTFALTRDNMRELSVLKAPGAKTR